VAPLAENKELQFHIFINTTKKEETLNLDVDGDWTKKIEYKNKYGQDDALIAELISNGLTKTLTFR
jgi:hypothetical protein